MSFSAPRSPRPPGAVRPPADSIRAAPPRHAPGGQAGGALPPNASRELPAQRAPDAFAAMAVDASVVSIPRKRPPPLGVGHRGPPPPKRSRLELAAIGSLAAPPERTRPLPTQRPPSPLRAPNGAHVASRPLLPSRFRPNPAAAPPPPPRAPIGKPLVPPDGKAKGKAKAFSKPVMLQAKPAVQGLKATAKERAKTYQGAEAHQSDAREARLRVHQAADRRLQDKTIRTASRAPGDHEPGQRDGRAQQAVRPPAHRRQADGGQRAALHGARARHGAGQDGDRAAARGGRAVRAAARRPTRSSPCRAPRSTSGRTRSPTGSPSPSRKVLVTSKEDQELAKGLARASRIVIVSRDCLALAFATCYSKQEVVRETARGNRKGVEWLRTPGTPLHPLFEKRPDVFLVDEAHVRLPAPTLTPTLTLSPPPPPPLSTCAIRLAPLRGAPPPRVPRGQARAAERHVRGQLAHRPGGHLQGGQRAARQGASRAKVYDLQDELTWLVNRCQKTINRDTVACSRSCSSTARPTRSSSCRRSSSRPSTTTSTCRRGGARVQRGARQGARAQGAHRAHAGRARDRQGPHAADGAAAAAAAVRHLAAARRARRRRVRRQAEQGRRCSSARRASRAPPSTRCAPSSRRCAPRGTSAS